MTDSSQKIVAALFLNPAGLETKHIEKICNVSNEEINNSVSEISYKLNDSGLSLVKSQNKLCLVANGEIAAKLTDENHKYESLSSVNLEVLAIIAYKQPITRDEIEAIRGINSEQTLKNLLERDLIAVQQRKVDGLKQSHFITTKNFLVNIGVDDINNLESNETKT